jgi:hypothetical protein
MKLPLVLGLSVFCMTANAAAVTHYVTGSWEAFNTWNPGQTGDNTLSTTPEGGPQMALEGRITYDDGTGEVLFVNYLQQVGTNTQNWDLNPDYPNTPEYDTVTMENFRWQSDSSDTLRLISGDVTCNGADNTSCGPGYQYGGNYVGAGGPLATFGPPYSLTDWIGASNEIAYMDVIDGPGFEGIVAGGMTSLYTTTYWNGFVALAATARYDLTVGTAVPVPAAAWLFGSALGLLGWARRRQQA